MVKKPQASAEKDQTPTSEEAASRASLMAATRKVMKSATGTDVEELQDRLVNQALAAAWVHKGQDQSNALLATIAALQAIAPTGSLEGMLAAQMVATHEAAMECLRRAMISEQTFEGRDANLKHATKLLLVYARQMEALAKHRGRGQQKITVEHVNVHAGGQAIVGNVEGSARSPSKAAPTPLVLSDKSENGIPLPDELTTLKRAKQPAQKSGK